LFDCTVVAVDAPFRGFPVCKQKEFGFNTLIIFNGFEGFTRVHFTVSAFDGTAADGHQFNRHLTILLPFFFNIMYRIETAALAKVIFSQGKSSMMDGTGPCYPLFTGWRIGCLI
jgi:hypothetical protein